MPCSTTAAGDAMLAGLVCAVTDAHPASKATTIGTMILTLCLPQSQDVNGAAVTIDGGTSA